jgi:hypothetical protein
MVDSLAVGCRRAIASGHRQDDADAGGGSQAFHQGVISGGSEGCMKGEGCHATRVKLGCYCWAVVRSVERRAVTPMRTAVCNRDGGLDYIR